MSQKTNHPFVEVKSSPQGPWDAPLEEPGHAIGVIAFCDESFLLAFFAVKRK
ncbi:MAG: hypothetical protein IPH93_16085 [Saprospiraceae bacterium]|nr:hypothetical protein [Saprospiraceae bacterium]